MNERELHPSASDLADSQPVDLRDDGLLWLINASVFHPRGFALAINTKTDRFVLLGNGSESWSFRPDHEPTPDQLLERAEALFSRAREGNRP